ncbi:MAG: hypothetical protein ACMUIG_00560, partial [Thermoplasmatota archaeon]
MVECNPDEIEISEDSTVNDPDFKYDLFISYSHKDEKWASWLHKALETYRVPKYLVGQDTAFGKVPDKLGKVFRD